MSNWGNREEKHALILGAALELFATWGFYATNVPGIAERAGVSVGTLYYYFVNKEAIVNALYRKLKADMGQWLADGFPAEATPREQFRWRWERMVAYAQAHPVAFAFAEMHRHEPYLDEASRTVRAQALAAQGELFEQGRRSGLFKPLPDAVLAAFVGGALRDLVSAAQEGRIEMTPEVVAQAEACSWEAISLPHNETVKG